MVDNSDSFGPTGAQTIDSLPRIEHPGLDERYHLIDNLTKSPKMSNLQCCCGRLDCAYLKHNDMALGGLEKDLDTAARLGQALLSRHESYISESQAEHARMTAYISELESERASLQNANEKIVAENRGLLSQLEALNSSLATSDNEVKRLEELLFDCELELKRLNGLVRRTEDLDDKVQEMEQERVVLNRRINEGRDEVRGTLARWRESERKVRELEEDVRRIEREARAERERHEELMARMEKERALERELGGAEGRLKGAAALQGMKSNAPGAKNVVSHFVRDILQDNANLQAGIAELRELLHSSNEEVQNLREQILMHQPVLDEEMQDQPIRAVSLSDELAQVQASPKQLQQEVHVHHHYHAKIAKKEKPITAKRPSRKRAVISTAHGYASDISSPSTPLSRPQRFTTSPVMPLSLQHPQPRNSNRWSMHSNTTQSSVFSSMPSSPRSYFDRNGSLFDRMEQGEESSRPTSPESMADFYSPSWKQPSRADDLGLGVFAEEEAPPTEILSPLSHQIIEEETISEAVSGSDPMLEERAFTPKPSILIHPDEDEDVTPRGIGKAPDDDSTISVATVSSIQSPLDSIPEIRPSIARRGSHESLVSISGMDIHLAQRPSPSTTLQLLRGNSSHFALSPSKPRMLSAAAPQATVTEYTAVSSHFEPLSPSSRTLRRVPSGIEALSGIAIPTPRVKQSRGPASANGGISRLVGGWVRGKWGIAPMRSSSDLRSVSAGAPSTQLGTGSETESSSSSSIMSGDSSKTTTGQQPSDHNTTPMHPNTMTDPSQVAPSFNRTGSEPAIKSQPSTSTPPKPIRTPAQRFATTMGNPSVDFNGFMMGRSPGVNQPGFIAGFRSTVMAKPTPSNVVGRIIDEEALKEGLCE